MKRKLSALLAALLLLPVLLLSASAVNGLGLPLICDAADLLTEEEEMALEAQAQALLDTYAMDVVILTVETLDGRLPQEYADDYFDNAGYGAGEDRSGMLLLLSMEERDLYISTHGDGIYVLTDYGIQVSTDEMVTYLSAGDYYGGFQLWLDVLPTYFDAFQAGSPIDGYADESGDYYHGTQEELVYYEEDVTPSILLSLMVGLPVGGITLLVMRFSMNTKRAQHSAGSYLKDGSYKLTRCQDMFLYSQVTKTPRVQKTDSGGHSGGGSSVHRSSSGSRHGGGGRKF